MRHIHPEFRLIWDGRALSASDLATLDPSDFAATPWLVTALSFGKEWLSGKDQFDQHTSGSTGKPKQIQLTRKQMQASARMTCDYFGICAGDNALLCISADFVGGKMMLVRAMERGLHLWATAPQASPFADLQETPQFQFIAMVPLQLQTLLKDDRVALESQKALKGIILGGAEVPASLEKMAWKLNLPIYSTYGMTETSSHVALRPLKPGVDWFEAFDEIKLGQDARGCLTLLSAVSNGELLVTNDVVELLGPHRFRWKGRIDNVINTGGVKVQVEELEMQLTTLFAEARISQAFAITHRPDEKLGQRIVLMLTGAVDQEKLQAIFQQLDRYLRPKEVVFAEELPWTESGKLDRGRLRLIIA